MKYLLIFGLALVSFAGFAQPMSYEQWQDMAKTQIDLQPEYGNAQKNASQIAADNELIAAVLKQDTTRRKGSDHLVQLGFEYLAKSDPETAIKRFNEAWLLDAKNENVYWGFGAIYGTFKDIPAAIVQYDKGLAINPKSVPIITDKATLFLVGYQRDNVAEELTTAIKLLSQAYSISAENVNTNYKLSIAYFLNKDCTNAWKFYKEYQRVGGEPRDPNYVEALKSGCPI